MEWASPPSAAPPQREAQLMMDVVLGAPSPPQHYPASSSNAHGSNGNAHGNSSSSTQPPLPAAAAAQYLHAPSPGGAAGAPPLSTEWSVDGHPLCHSRLLSATGVMGRVEAYRRRPMEKEDWQQQQQQTTAAAAGMTEEFLVRLTDGCEGVVTEPLVQEGIARLLATASSEEAWARGKEDGVVGGSAGGGGGSSSTSPKRKDKSGSHHRRESSSGGGGAGGSLGIAAGTVERLTVPLPMEPADKSCLTPGETRRCLELVRRLATPYFAREFSQPIEELHPEVWKEVCHVTCFFGMQLINIMYTFPY